MKNFMISELLRPATCHVTALIAQRLARSLRKQKVFFLEKYWLEKNMAAVSSRI